MASAAPNQPLFFQLYKNTNDAIALERVREVERLGYKAFFLTVDAIVAGNRERDLRSPWVEEEMEKAGTASEGEGGGDSPRDVNKEVEEDDNESLDFGGTAGGLVKNDDRDMTWEKVGFASISFLQSSNA